MSGHGISKFTAIVVVFFSLLLSSNVGLAVPPKYKAKTFIMNAQADYYWSEANYSATGGRYDSLENNRSYKLSILDLYTLYGLSNRGAVFGNIGVAKADSSNTDFSRSNSQLTEITMGYSYFLLKKPINVIPDISATLPLNSFDDSTDDVLTGNGVFAAQMGSWFSMKMGSVKPYAYLGYKHQGDGMAGLVVWKAGAYKVNKTWVLGGELNGYAAAVDDQYIEEAIQREAVTNRVNGGSKHFYSVNPELMQYKIFSAYRLDRFTSIKFGYEASFNGSNAAAGSRIFAGFRWRYEAASYDPEDPFLGEEKKALNKFNVESNKLDESLFKSKKPKKKKRRRKKRRKKTYEDNW